MKVPLIQINSNGTIKENQEKTFTTLDCALKDIEEYQLFAKKTMST